MELSKVVDPEILSKLNAPTGEAAKDASSIVNSVADSTLQSLIPTGEALPNGLKTEDFLNFLKAGASGGIPGALQGLGEQVGQAVRGSTQNIRDAAPLATMLPNIAGGLGAADMLSNTLTPQGAQQFIGGEGLGLAGQESGVLPKEMNIQAEVPTKNIPEAMNPSWLTKTSGDFSNWASTANPGDRFELPGGVSIESRIVKTNLGNGLPEMDPMQVLKVDGPEDLLRQYNLKPGDTIVGTNKIQNLMTGLSPETHPTTNRIMNFLMEAQPRDTMDLPRGAKMYVDSINDEGAPVYTILPKPGYPDAESAIRKAGIIPGNFYTADESQINRFAHGLAPVTHIITPGHTIPGYIANTPIKIQGSLGVNEPPVGYSGTASESAEPDSPFYQWLRGTANKK